MIHLAKATSEGEEPKQAEEEEELLSMALIVEL
jgi:hypothetical protein